MRPRDCPNMERKTIPTSVRSWWIATCSTTRETFLFYFLHPVFLWMHCAAVRVTPENNVKIAAISDNFFVTSTCCGGAPPSPRNMRSFISQASSSVFSPENLFLFFVPCNHASVCTLRWWEQTFWLVTASLVKHTHELMKWLWTADGSIHCVPGARGAGQSCFPWCRRPS